jgi:phage recombination protein Bet
MTLQQQLEASLELEEEPRMSTAMAKPEVIQPITRMPEQGFSREKVELIKRTIAVGATGDELELFLYAAKKTGLDPFMKQIYAVKRWNKQAGREVMTVQTGIDGYRLIADRTGKLAGISDPVYEDGAGKLPKSATVIVKKLLGNGSVAEFTATARWDEYVQMGREGVTAMWASKPYLMLGKCAEALALRKAFPADLTGVYTAEEMSQADNESHLLPQSSMVLDDYASHKEAIESAPDMDSLQDSFAKAYTAARTLRDQSSMKAFMEAKDKRKVELA